MKINSIDLNEVYKNRKVTKSTFRQYEATLNSIKKNYGEYKLNDLDKVLNNIKNESTLYKYKNWASLLIVSYNHYFKVAQKEIRKRKNYLKELSNESDKINNAPSKQEISQYKEIKKGIKNNVKIISKEIKKGTKFNEKLLLDYITLYFYAVLPPRRTDNRLLTIGNNSIDLSNKIIHYPPHKIKKISTTMDLSNHPNFLNLIKVLNKRDGEHLYPKSLQEQTMFSKYVKNIFEKHFDFKTNIQKLRRLSSLEDIGDLEKIKKKSKEMNHSFDIHVKTYMKQSP